MKSDAAILTLTGPHGTDPLITTATAVSLGSDEIRYPATTQITDNLTSSGGIFAIAGTTNLNDESGDALTVAPGAAVLVNGSQTFSSLTINPGGTVRQIRQDTTLGNSVITVDSLEIDSPDSTGNNGGVLDLGNGDLIMKSSISPDTSGTGSSEIFTLLAAGYNGGLWNGEAASGPTPAAIISSGAANDPYQIEALGYAQIGTDTGELNLTSYDGQSVSSGDTIVALTYYGDANLDRTVDSTDYGMMGGDTTYGATAIGGWEDGDFNYDGAANAIDEYLIDDTSSFMATLAAGSKPSIVIQAVDVPATLNNGTKSATATITISNGADPTPCTITAITDGAGHSYNAGSITVGVPAAQGNGQYTVSLTADASALRPGTYIVTMSLGSLGNKGFVMTVH